MVSVQTKTQYSVDDDTLLGAQLELLGHIAEKNERKPKSLDVGAELLGGELRKIKEDHVAALRPVLLVIDNVPEGESGIGGLLPADLEDCLADG